MLARSRVVHASLDPSVPITTRKMIGTTEDAGPSTAGKEGNDAARPIKEEDDEDEEGGTDPDRSITNAREAKPEDGLLNTSQLRHLFQEAGAPVRSMYDEAQRSANSAATCGPRLDLPPERLGSHEPEWTSYTQYWKTVLGDVYLYSHHIRH
jgi:RNA exonuclease NGL2